jgi:outer membrane immunogenic protein
MKKLLCASVAFIALATVNSASAADLPPSPVYKAPVMVPAPAFSWTGFYFGLNAGGHWDRDNISGAPDPVGFTAAGVNPAVLSSLIGGSLHPNGFIGGGQIGYNWQTSNVVFGVEADAQGLTGKSSRTVSPLIAAGLAPGDFTANSSNAETLVTFRGRIGVTFDRTWLYATGGGAWGTVKTTDTFAAVGGTLISSATTMANRGGWTVGGGVEQALTSNLSIKAEYLFVDLGKFNDTTAPIVGFPATDITFTHSYTENIARAGLNYRLNP